MTSTCSGWPERVHDRAGDVVVVKRLVGPGAAVEERRVDHPGLDQGHPDPLVVRASCASSWRSASPVAVTRPLGRRVHRSGERPPAGDRAGDHEVAGAALEQMGRVARIVSATPRTLVRSSRASARATHSTKSRGWRRSRRFANTPSNGRRRRSRRRRAPSLSAHSVKSQRPRSRVRRRRARRPIRSACPPSGRRARAGSGLGGGAGGRGADPARGAGDQKDGVVGHRSQVPNTGSP